MWFYKWMYWKKRCCFSIKNGMSKKSKHFTTNPTPWVILPTKPLCRRARQKQQISLRTFKYFYLALVLFFNWGILKTFVKKTTMPQMEKFPPKLSKCLSVVDRVVFDAFVNLFLGWKYHFPYLNSKIIRLGCGMHPTFEQKVQVKMMKIWFEKFFGARATLCLLSRLRLRVLHFWCTFSL